MNINEIKTLNVNIFKLGNQATVRCDFFKHIPIAKVQLPNVGGSSNFVMLTLADIWKPADMCCTTDIKHEGQVLALFANTNFALVSIELFEKILMKLISEHQQGTVFSFWLCSYQKVPLELPFMILTLIKFYKQKKSFLIRRVIFFPN